MQKEVSQVKSSSAKTPSQDDDLGMLGANDVDALMKLARKQGMNTDVRRNVFVIMMSSEVRRSHPIRLRSPLILVLRQDYRHACQRLSQLKYTDVQQREFVRVALHCLGVVSPAWRHLVPPVGVPPLTLVTSFARNLFSTPITR
jgi:nucleolar MIF4G domain-containing protein 1